MRKVHYTFLLVLILVSFRSTGETLYSRNLECENQKSLRSAEICTALEKALKWSWMGHAIVSPGFRTDTNRVKEVYCSLPVKIEDTPILVGMAVDTANSSKMHKVQLNIGIVDLLSLLGAQALERFPALDKIDDERERNAVRDLKAHITIEIGEFSTSIFSPAHPQYILRDGCT